jgi:hypothetical protein
LVIDEDFCDENGVEDDGENDDLIEITTKDISIPDKGKKRFYK